MAKDRRKPKGEKQKSGRNNLLPAIVVAVGLLGGAHLVSSKPAATATAAAAEAPAEEAKPEPGAVVPLAPLTVNLADGHFLKVGLALQMTADAEVDAGEEGPSAAFAAPALDETIATFGSKTFDELGSVAGRGAVKEELTKRIADHYEGAVMGVYFTEFVMQ